MSSLTSTSPVNLLKRAHFTMANSQPSRLEMGRVSGWDRDGAGHMRTEMKCSDLAFPGFNGDAGIQKLAGRP